MTLFDNGMRPENWLCPQEGYVPRGGVAKVVLSGSTTAIPPQIIPWEMTEPVV